MELRILHLITSLDVGGTETVLYRLLSHIKGPAFRSEVISLTSIGRIGEAINALGIPVRALGMRPGRPALSALLRLVAWLRRHDHDLIQTWLYHADLLGLIAGGLGGGPPVVWNLRASNTDMSQYRRLSGWTVRACAKLSSRPKAVIVNSEAGLRYHHHIGYRPKRWVVIPNGVDTDQFQPDTGARLSVREELELSPETFLVGFIARYDPMKDHETFFHAIQNLLKTYPSTHFLLCGSGVADDNLQLVSLLESLNIKGSISLLGERNDIPRLTAALDVACSSSMSEGFPNIIAEAMACGVPCVVTDVGDSASIVGDTGRVVAPRDPIAMATAFQEILGLDVESRRILGNHARKRVLEHYSLMGMVQRYEQLYVRLAADK